MNSGNKILYQAYGKKYINQTILSIISLVIVYNKKLPNALSITVFTDDPASFGIFSAYNVTAVYVSKETIQKWKGEDDFIFRIKIKAFQEILQSFSGSVLYVDSDTFFMKRICKIFDNINEGYFYLFKREWPLHHGRKEWHPTLCPNEISFRATSGNDLIVSDNTVMFNAGVIGIASSELKILDDVLELTDVLYKENPYFLMEQLSFSLVLNNTNKLLEASDFIIHYWYDKKSVDEYIQKTFEGVGLNSLDNILGVVKKDRLFHTSRLELLYTKVKKRFNLNSKLLLGK